MTLIAIPPTIEEAVSALDGIGTLLTAKEWHRAAIVWAFTRDGRGKNPSSEVLDVKAFAALKISGLRSENTVAAYRAAWQAAIDSGHAAAVEPGCQRVLLPELDWPRVDHKADNRPQERVRRALMEIENNPELADEVVKASPAVHRAIDRAAARVHAERGARNRAEIAEVCSESDRKANSAALDEALEPLEVSLANLRVVGDINRAALSLRSAEPGEALMAEIDAALADLSLARYEMDFRQGVER